MPLIHAFIRGCLANDQSLSRFASGIPCHAPTLPHRETVMRQDIFHLCIRSPMELPEVASGFLSRRLGDAKGDLASPVYILPTFIIAKCFILINGRSFYALLFPCASSGFVHLAFPVFALMKTRPHVMPCGTRFHSPVYIKTRSHVASVFI